MDNLVEINGKQYAIDLEKIMSFIGGDPSIKNSIKQNYDGNGKLLSKEATESKDSISEAMADYRYNLVTNLLTLITTPISDGNTIIATEDTSNMHLGQKLAFNTLIEMEIIYEIETED